MGEVKRVRVLAACLAAVFALGMVLAGGASAKLPEFGGCEAAPGHEGKYADAGCTEPVKKVYGKYTGGYEWYVGEEFGKGYGLNEYIFRGSIGPTTFETANGKVIQCSGGDLHHFQIVGPQSVGKIWTIFEGCESEGQECASKFHEEGEISDEIEWLEGEGLKGELVYVAGKKTSTPTVGVTLTPFKTGAPLFTVVCEGTLGTVEIGGAGGKKTEKSKGNAVISLISPINEMTRYYTQTFSQSGSVQDPDVTERGKPMSLQEFLSNENKWVGLGIATTFQYTAESRMHPVEIKAAP